MAISRSARSRRPSSGAEATSVTSGSGKWVAGCPYFIGGDQFDYWKHTALTLEGGARRGSGFSVESPRGVRFIVRSRVLEPEELAALPPPATGPEALEGGAPDSQR